MNRDHSVIFEIASKYCNSDSFVDYDGYSISSKGFLPTVVWSSELNSPIPVHFSSLTPNMSKFTLAISCLNTSNLPWFTNLTLQVPMQYCSLQHQSLLLLPVTSTTGCCFCFGSISSFFLELFPHSSPVVYLATTGSLSNSMKLWAMLCGATQVGWVMAENSDKMWSAGEGNGKPLQYSCLENPMNSMNSIT